MRALSCVVPLLLVAACSAATTSPVVPASFTMPETMLLLNGSAGEPLATGELLRRMADADLVLLGEVHDNALHHVLRGQLLSAFASRRPAVVFEQFIDSDVPIPPPASTEDLEHWLDAHGFDRKGWGWPLHRPVVAAARAHARSLWGSELSRDALQGVIRRGESAVPEPLRRMIAEAPMDSADIAIMDAELVEGHCGQLPASMIPGMRAAQIARDAAMARALLRAREQAGSAAWLFAGDGHVRDVGVPRILGHVAPDLNVLTVGLLERSESGAIPDSDELREYDLAIVTPRAEREDPCKQMLSSHEQ
jgi:uncharacterized iron-regulated protein